MSVKRVQVWDASARTFCPVELDAWVASVVKRWADPDHCVSREYREGFADSAALVLAHVRGDADMKTALSDVVRACERPKSETSVVADKDAEHNVTRALRLEKLLTGAIGALRAAGKNEVADKLWAAAVSVGTEGCRRGQAST